MPLKINNTPEDHIPEEFTIESLTEGGLTEQEIEALSTGEDPIVEAKPAAADAAAAEAEAEAEIDGAIGAPPPEEPEAKAAEPAQQPAQAAEVPEPEEDKIDLPEIPDVSESEQVVANIDQKLEALAEQYDDGELTRSEFIEQQKALASEQAKAQAAINNATELAVQARDKILKHWNDNLNAYKEDAPGLWSDAHLKEWDRYLRDVTNAEKNPQFANLSRRQQIEIAHRRYATDYEAVNGKPLDGDAALPSASKSAKRQQQEEAKLKRREDDRPEAPTTLAGLNSDGTTEIEDSTFGSIDRTIMKDPVRAEELLMSLTEDQRERYLTEV